MKDSFQFWVLMQISAKPHLFSLVHIDIILASFQLKTPLVSNVSQKRQDFLHYQTCLCEYILHIHYAFGLLPIYSEYVCNEFTMYMYVFINIFLVQLNR